MFIYQRVSNYDPLVIFQTCSIRIRQLFLSLTKKDCEVFAFMPRCKKLLGIALCPFPKAQRPGRPPRKRDRAHGKLLVLRHRVAL